MSNDDYMVDPLSDSEVRENAKRLRRFLGLADAERIDPLALEQVKAIWTVRGVKPFRFEIVANADLPEDSGLTSYGGAGLLIQIPRRIRHDAFMGDGYARYTIAHELGHATLHLDKLIGGAAMPRRRIGNATSNWIPKFKSAEHQAMVFGGAFLINDVLARGLSSPEVISVQAGISLQAARIYFEQVQEELSRPASSERVGQMADQVRAALAPKPATSISPQYLTDLCTCCGQQKLFPVGHKFMCQACDTIHDRFQDGDSVQ
jgi:hypothetical protein